MASLGQKSRAIRRARLMRQEDLAEHAGVGLATIRRLESERAVPRPETIRKIADALNVDPLLLADPSASVATTLRSGDIR